MIKHQTKPIRNIKIRNIRQRSRNLRCFSRTTSKLRNILSSVTLCHIVSQSRYWVNPNETFKIGYNGKTRTAALNTDAFTRIRENIQYYFVPFQSLWKYFEQQVNNMTKGDAGQNISKFASSSTEASKITTTYHIVTGKQIGRAHV